MNLIWFEFLVIRTLPDRFLNAVLDENSKKGNVNTAYPPSTNICSKQESIPVGCVPTQTEPPRPGQNPPGPRWNTPDLRGTQQTWKEPSLDPDRAPPPDLDRTPLDPDGTPRT